MTSTWKQILIAFVIGALAGSAVTYRYAPPHRPAFHKGGMIDRLAKDLGLSSVQKKKVRVILEKHRESFKALREEARPRMDALKESMKRQINEVLTPEQQKKFAELKTRWESCGPRGHRRGMPPPPPDRD